jgi:hypothetical protein
MAGGTPGRCALVCKFEKDVGEAGAGCSQVRHCVNRPVAERHAALLDGRHFKRWSPCYPTRLSCESRVCSGCTSWMLRCNPAGRLGRLPATSALGRTTAMRQAAQNMQTRPRTARRSLFTRGAKQSRKTAGPASQLRRLRLQVASVRSANGPTGSRNGPFLRRGTFEHLAIPAG